MNKLSWTNKQDGVDIVAASDINTVAGAVIDTQDELDNKADLVNGQVPASQLENAPFTTVEDTLTSTSATNALSAKQGKVLNEKVTTQTNATIYSAKRVVDWDSATVLEQWSPTFISKSAVSTDKYYFLDLDFTGDIPYLQLTENCLQGSYLDGAVSVDGQQTPISFQTHTILANTVNGNVATVILERKSTDTFEFTDKTVFSNIGIVDGDVFHIDVVWDETQNGYFTLLQKAREEIRNINEEIGDVETVLDDLIGGDGE